MSRQALRDSKIGILCGIIVFSIVVAPLIRHHEKSIMDDFKPTSPLVIHFKEF